MQRKRMNKKWQRYFHTACLEILTSSQDKKLSLRRLEKQKELNENVVFWIAPVFNSYG